MRDVARIASVSPTTVSHVLNKSRRVEPQTERAVLDAVEATGYSGHRIARSLRTGSTSTIGLALSAISNPYFGDVVHAVEQNATAAGYSILLADTHDDPDRERRAVRDLLAHGVDGIIMAPSAEPWPALDTAKKQGVPVVFIDRVPRTHGATVDAVGVVNEEPTATLVDHLAQHGHTRIAMVTSTPGLTTTVERLAGFKLGLERNGLPEDPALIKEGLRGEDSVVDSLFAAHSPPTALVLGNNQVTIGTMAAFQRRGIRVPDDIALAVFDDFPWAESFAPRLTAISQPVDEIGSRAVTLLLERLVDRDGPNRVERLPATLHVRDSCGHHPA